jgi:hypothetical protein
MLLEVQFELTWQDNYYVLVAQLVEQWRLNLGGSGLNLTQTLKKIALINYWEILPNIFGKYYREVLPVIYGNPRDTSRYIR